MLGARILPLALAGALVVVDQATKSWVAANVPLGVREASWGLGFHLTHTRNTGAAFGVLREFQLVLGPVLIDGTVVLGLLSLVVSIGLIGYLALHGPRLAVTTRIALGLVLAGAVGNMIDRFARGSVIDFVHFDVGWFEFPVFNVADAAVVAGAALLVLVSLFGDPRRRRVAAEAPGPVGTVDER